MASRLDVSKNGREHFSSHVWHRRPPDRPPIITPADGKVRSAGKIFETRRSLEDGLEGQYLIRASLREDRASLYLFKWEFWKKRKKNEGLLNLKVRFSILTQGVSKKDEKIIIYFVGLIFEKNSFFSFFSFNFSDNSLVFEISQKSLNLVRLGVQLRFDATLIDRLFNAVFQLGLGELLIKMQTLSARAIGETIKTRTARVCGEKVAPGSAMHSQMRRQIPNIASVLRKTHLKKLVIKKRSLFMACAKKEQGGCPFCSQNLKIKKSWVGEPNADENLFPVLISSIQSFLSFDFEKKRQPPCSFLAQAMNKLLFLITNFFE
jgi:hypothetical protein